MPEPPEGLSGAVIAFLLGASQNYQIVIPLTEVQSVNFFDDDVHEDYNKYFVPSPPAPEEVNSAPETSLGSEPG